MLSIGIKNLKNNLSRYLARVKKGEIVLVTERGRPIARIVKEGAEGENFLDALTPMIVEGSLSLPERQINRDIPDPISVKGKPISEMVVEDRR